MNIEQKNKNQIHQVRKVSKFRIILKFVKLFLFTIFRTKWFIPGILEITAEKLYEWIKSDKNLLIIDTRDRIEFFATEGSLKIYGHIKGSKCIPIMELPSNLQNLSAYRERKIVTVCPGGGMSLVAAEILKQAGFTDVYSLKKGLDHWNKKGYPTVTGKDLGVTTEDIRNMISKKEKKTSEVIEYEKMNYQGEIHQTIDARNLNCPLPILKSKK